jgi:hypothetical protein
MLQIGLPSAWVRCSTRDDLLGGSSIRDGLESPAHTRASGRTQKRKIEALPYSFVEGANTEYEKTPSKTKSEREMLSIQQL